MGAVEIAVLGLIGTVATQLLKKLTDKIGGTYSLVVAFATVFVAALVWTLLQQYAPAEFLETLVASFGLAVAWYEVILKKVQR